MYKYPLNGGGFPLAEFVCYMRYYLHHGFKINMQLKFNILQVITLLKWLLNIFVCVLNLMTIFHAF